MKQNVISRLLAVNRQFYQTFGGCFSEKRQHVQPGVKQLVTFIAHDAKILDLGCGNGEFACQLSQHGFHGEYSGLDFSQELLDEAHTTVRECIPEEKQSSYYFSQADLSSTTWDSSFKPASFDLITAFAVLHHIPGMDLRQQLLHKVKNLITPDGQLLHSVWQFLNSPRLVRRIQPWEIVNLSETDVDPGDYLLDWRHGGAGLRYVHHFTAGELSALAERTGFTIEQSFHADGQGGRLGLYQIWTPISN